MSGTYTAAPGQYAVLELKTSGTAGAPITYEAAPGQHPVIDSSGLGAGIYDGGASYITIKGFEVKGDAASLNATSAQAQAGTVATTGKGIFITSGSGGTPVHVTVEDTVVHDEPGAGIWAGHGDYISILDNTTYRNAFWSNDADSGISVGWMVNSDGNTTSYKTVVSGNVSYDNREYMPWGSKGITDGNGIIVDSDNLTGYTGRTLVADNVAYGNGGTGMHSTGSSNVDILNNTAFGNNQTPSLQEGQIDAQNGSANRIENNILESSPGGVVNERDAGVTYDYNVDFGGTVAMQGAHDIVADPMLVSPGTGNFTLQAGSPAIGSANAALTVPTDAAGDPRPGGSGYDRGAYEYQGGSPAPTPTPPPAPAPTSPVINGGTYGSGPDTLVVTLAEDAYQGDAQGSITLDGHALTSTPLTVTAIRGQGQTETYTLQGSFGAGAHQVGVTFLNDAYAGTPATDRNLYVDGVALDGAGAGAGVTNYGAHGSALELYSTGDSATYAVTGGTGVAAPVLNGGTYGTGPDTLVVTLTEDAYLGDAQASLTLDGHALTASPVTVTALHGAGESETFTVKGSFGVGPHDLAVSFLNDAYAGTPATDRNLYVAGATLDGQAATSESVRYGGTAYAASGTLGLYSTGDAATLHFAAASS
jgi:parallel beta-helix repeat protein